MNRKFAAIALLLALLLALVACQSPTPQPTEEPTEEPTAVATEEPTAEPTEEPVEPELTMELVGLDGVTQTLTLSELTALPSTEGWGGRMSSTGNITPPSRFRGVPVDELCALVGGLQAGTAVRIVAADGYAMTISYDQIANGDFITYDPGTGGERPTTGSPLRVLVAYEEEGQPIPEQTDGTMRLALVNDDQMQVTDGHWWVKWVRRLEVISLAQDWSLHLSGVIAEDMDRNTFESCSSPSCHQAAWTDDSNQQWVGTALWHLVARVDDENQHDLEAFDRELAAAGYTVDIVAADGYTVSFDSQRIQENNNILVAFLLNGNPLNEDDFPLRLVGSDLQRNEMVGQIAQIVVHVPGAQAPAPEATEATEAPAPSGDAALEIVGLVEQPMSWSLADLQALDVVEIEAEHPSRGMQSYRGVRLNALLDLVAPTADAHCILITAADGFSSDIPLADIRACTDCLVAFNDDGTLSMAMPGFGAGSNWVSGVVNITVQRP